MSDLKRTSNEAPLKDVLDRWLKAYGLEGKMKELDIVEAWPKLMGTAVANRTEEIKIRNGKENGQIQEIGVKLSVNE